MRALEIAAVAALPAAIVLPHLLPLHKVNPLSAAVVWLAVLALRALVAIAAAIFIVVYMPQTGVYDAVAQWCWHEALPIIAIHTGLSGHPVVHAAILLPGLALAASVVWLLFGLVRAWLGLRARLRRTLGVGPLGSTVIEDEHLVVGVTQLGRGRIVVSNRALEMMDPEELEASLSHELGHIHRRHRPLLLLASLLAALGRLLPGTAVAERELRFSLERDADEYAVRRTSDPVALASAICKAATAESPVGATGLEGGGRVVARLDWLAGYEPRPGRRLQRGSYLLALVLLGMTLALSATLPSWALAVPRAEHSISAFGSHCEADSPHH
jgi:Peptidase family M48